MSAPTFPIRELDGSLVTRLASGLGIHPVTARCLAARGITAEPEARSYLAPRLGALRRPDGLEGLGEAVERLGDAVLAGERVGVFGDYDVDGVTTAALLASFLRAAGAACTARVARRDAGYGFQEDDVRALAGAGCTVIVTGDCGTCDLGAIAAARARGIDVIVIDHHAVPPADSDAPHPALALINPLRADSTFPFTGMASVGLAFYVMAALKTHLGARGAAADLDMRRLLDLVALGTIADLVPLARENRILAAHGLQALARSPRPGIAALIRAAGVDDPADISERTVAWKLAPRLNAPGRLGDAAPALELLLADDEAAAAGAAAALEDANQRRRSAQQRVLAEAREIAAGQPERDAVVVAGEGWPSGVVGIVAAQLVRELGRPAFVIAVDPERGEARGSARSVPGVDLVAVLRRCSDRLVRFGGHAGAAGLTAVPEGVRSLAPALAEAVAAERSPGAGSGLAPADAEVELGAVDDRLTAELGSLAPFGRGNDEPRLVTRGLRVRTSRRVGDGSHLKLELEDGGGSRRSAIGFGLGELDPGAGATVDALYAPEMNTWGGRRRVELRVCELRVPS